MIYISEHFGFNHSAGNYSFKDEQLTILQQKNYKKTFKRSQNSEELCFHLLYDETSLQYKIDSSYIIGVDWIVKNKLPIYIKPKLNDDKNEVDYLSMLFEALQETESLKHLENLYQIDFNAPLIEIKQREDFLSPLLVIEFLNLLKQIVKKGLKKSYYDVNQNLSTRVKGKVLVNATVKQNHTRGKLQYNYCKYQEFGYNSIENRLLKKALLFSESLIANHKSLSTSNIKQLFNYIRPAFSTISADISLREVTNLKHNPFYKEYKPAIQIAKTLLKRFSYNISQTSQEQYKTPPFWIDMPKLFELYLFKKLKEVFPSKGEVIYHKKFHSLEPDLLLKSKDGKFNIIIDAKYKPRYEDGNILHNDASQVSGYSRLKSIRKEFGLINEDKILDTLIIYTSNNSINESIGKAKLLLDEDPRYYKLYKYSIQLPKL